VSAGDPRHEGDAAVENDEVAEVTGPTEAAVARFAHDLGECGYRVSTLIKAGSQEVSVTFPNGTTVFGQDEFDSYLTRIALTIT